MEGGREESVQMKERGSLLHRCRQALTVEWTLVVFKIQYFFLMGAEELDQVFLKLMLKEGGMTPTQMGFIAGMSPIAASLSTLMVSSLANRYRISKLVLLVASAATAGVAYATAAIPVPDVIANCTTLGLPPNTSTLNTELQTQSWFYLQHDLDVYFYSQLLANMGFWIFRALTLTFTDVALIAFLGESGMHKYARQVSFGALGSAVLSIGAGAVIALIIIQIVVCDVELTYTRYAYAYYVAAVAMAVCFPVSCTFRFEKVKGELLDSKDTTIALSATPLPSPLHSEAEDETGNLTLGRKKKKYNKNENEDYKFSSRRLVGVLSSVHYVSWIMMVFFISFNWSISTYTYLYLDQLGADSLLVGAAGGVTSVSDIVFFLLGFWIVQKLGTINSLFFALLMQVLRFAILVVIINPWLGLLAAALDGASMAVPWVAMMQHVTDGFPKAYTTTVIGIVHGTFYGIGYGTGQLVGGIVIDAIGARFMFAAFAGAMFIFTGIFYLVQKLSKRPSFDDEQLEVILKSEFSSAVNKLYGTDT